MVNGLFFEIGLLDKHLTRSIKNCLGCIQTNGLDRIDNPLVDLIRELTSQDSGHAG